MQTIFRKMRNVS